MTEPTYYYEYVKGQGWVLGGKPSSRMVKLGGGSYVSILFGVRPQGGQRYMSTPKSDFGPDSVETVEDYFERRALTRHYITQFPRKNPVPTYYDEYHYCTIVPV